MSLTPTPFRPSGQPWLTVAVAVAMAVGAAATAWGIALMPWPACIPFSRQGLDRLLLLLGGGTTAVLVTSVAVRVPPLLAGTIVALALALFAGALWPLMVVGWIALSCLVLGDALVPADDGDAPGAWSVRFLVGAAVLGTLVGLLAHVPVNGPPLYAALLLGPILARWNRLPHLCATMRQACTGMPAVTPAAFWLQIAVAVLSLLHIVVGLMPEVAHDGLAMHLLPPTHLATRGKWGFDAGLYAWAVMPMLGNWLFSLGYMFAGEQGARLVNVLCILTLGWLIHDLVSWGGGTARGAAWGAILFLSTPLTFTESSSVFVEPAWSCFIVAGILVLLNAGDSPKSTGRLLPVAGILFGAALAAKAWSLVMLPVVAAVAIAAYPSLLHPRNLPSIAVALAACIAVGSVPYVTAWWLTDNPVFPFYNQIFQSRLFPTENFVDRRWHAALSWKTIYDVTFDSGRYLESRNGAAGFEWLPLLPVAAIVLGARMHKRGLVLAGMGVGSVLAIFALTSYLRYVFPAEVLLLAAIGVGISHVPTALKTATALTLASVASLNCLFLNAGPNYYDDFPLQAVFSRQARDAYVETRVPQRKAIAVVNELNVAHTPVAIIGGYATAGLASDAVLSGWYNQRFKAALSTSVTAEDFQKEIISRGIDYIILDPGWETAEKRSQLESLSEPVFESPGVSVRRMRDDRRYAEELVQNPVFGPDMTGWSIPECVARTEHHELVVTAACHAYQIVTARPGVRYRNTVTGRCQKGTAFARTQLNWLDRAGAVIRVDGEVFECGEKAAEHVMIVTAPENAASVVVYTCGHTDAQVVISANSLRQ